MSPLQFHDHGRQITIPVRFKHNICETFSSWHFSMQGVVFLGGVVCKRNHTGQCVFIIIFQNRCVCLMCLFNQFCNCLLVTGKCGLQQPFRRTNCLYNWLPSAVFNRIDKLLPHLSVRNPYDTILFIIGQIAKMH